MSRFMFVSPTGGSFVVDTAKAASLSERVRIVTESGKYSMNVPEVGPIGQICITEFTDGVVTADQCAERASTAGIDELCMLLSACVAIGYDRCTESAVRVLAQLPMFDPVRLLAGAVPNPGELE
jgi:hypothetical protein